MAPRGKAFGRNWSAKKGFAKKRVREETIFVVVNYGGQTFFSRGLSGKRDMKRDMNRSI